MDHIINPGSTSQMIEVTLRSSTTGQLLTGKLHSDMTIKYQRSGAAAAVTLTPVTATLGTWTSSGWKETQISGVYQFGVPNEALVAGVGDVLVVFACTGAIDSKARISLAPAVNVTLWAGVAVGDEPPTAQEVWEYITRTLTQSSTSTTDSTAAGSIARRRGDSWSISLTIGAITGYTSLWFTAKWDRDNTDAMAVLQIKKNASGSGDGLLYVNGATAANAALGSITVTDATTGAIVIAVDETVTDDLPPAGIYYDVQALISGSVSTLDSGTLTISADVTRAVA